MTSTHSRLAEAWAGAYSFTGTAEAYEKHMHHAHLAMLERVSTPPYIRAYVDDDGPATVILGLNRFGPFVSAAASANYTDLALGSSPGRPPTQESGPVTVPPGLVDQRARSSSLGGA